MTLRVWLAMPCYATACVQHSLRAPLHLRPYLTTQPPFLRGRDGSEPRRGRGVGRCADPGGAVRDDGCAQPGDVLTDVRAGGGHPRRRGAHKGYVALGTREATAAEICAGAKILAASEVRLMGLDEPASSLWCAGVAGHPTN
jgi:hypothetical protein